VSNVRPVVVMAEDLAAELFSFERGPFRSPLVETTWSTRTRVAPGA
jgi:hypothetical protein